MGKLDRHQRKEVRTFLESASNLAELDHEDIIERFNIDDPADRRWVSNLRNRLLKRRAEGIEPKPRGVQATVATPRPTAPKATEPRPTTPLERATELSQRDQLILRLIKIRGLRITKTIPSMNFDPGVYNSVKDLAGALGWTVSVCSNRLLALILDQYGLLKRDKETSE
jgi:hypothetical protein